MTGRRFRGCARSTPTSIGCSSVATREVEQLATLLRSPAERAEGAVLLVVGPSGCGKSSLVRAGLLPVMADEPGWQTVPPILPGADPVAALTRELAATARQLGMGWSTAEVRRRLDDGGLAELADDLLLAGPGPRRTHLLVVVDQFEELLTQAAPAERARFAELLGPALAGPVQVVGTLRPEFLDQLLADPDLAVLPTRVHTLRPLRREALRSVIEGPARLAGIDVDEDLVARLVADTDSGEALPLLAYTLAQLADGVGRGGRLLASRYEQLGGVQGALTRRPTPPSPTPSPRAAGAATRWSRSCCGWSPSTSRAVPPGGGSAATSCPTRWPPSWTPSSRAGC